MSWPNEERPCAWVRERIDAFLDGDLSPEEASLTDAHINRCRNCAHELEMAQRVVRSLRALPEMHCPDRVVDAVYDHVGAAQRTWVDRWLAWLWKPAIVGVAAAALLIVTTMVGLQWKTPSQVSAEEIKQAEVDAKLALALVTQVSKRATSTVREDVLEERVAVPMMRVLEQSIKIKMPAHTGEVQGEG